MADKKVIEKSDWISDFTLVGKPNITDFTFKLNERSNESNYVYNSLNLGVNCGERYGTVYAEMMGGYSDKPDANNVIYAHGKKDDGSDDFSKQIVVNWEDRFDPDVLDEIGELSFITVGLEKTSKSKKTFYNKFLSAFDAIEYIEKCLTKDMTIYVRGNLKYSSYKGKTQNRKNITNIVLSEAEEKDYRATFRQSVLYDKTSASLKNIDKTKSVMFVDGRVLDYVKEMNGVEVKGQFPFPCQFEWEMDFTNEAQCRAVVDKVFKVKKDVNQMTFEGIFVEGGASVAIDYEKDVPDEIKELVEANVYTKEQAIEACTAKGNREQRMILKRPYIKLVGEEKMPVLQRFEAKYKEDDLYLDYVYANDGDDIEVDTTNVESTNIDSDDMSWMDNL